MKHFITLGSLTAIFLASTSLTAQAQTQTAAPTSDSAQSSVSIGAALVIAPEYLGAKKERFLLAPTLSYRNGNGFFAGIGEGVGFSGKIDRFDLSAALAYRIGRRDGNANGLRHGSDDLRGMGDIDDAFTTRLKGSYTFDSGVSLHLGSEFALSNRETGNTYSLGFKVPVFESKTDQVSFNIGSTYGDRKYNQSNFGVTSAQSTASGYKAFTAKAGFDQVTSTLGWNHVIDKNWSINTRLGLTQVVGNAADSPIVKKKTAGVLGTSINYAF